MDGTLYRERHVRSQAQLWNDRDKFATRDTTILQKTNSNNFYALQANANVADFYEEQMKLINEAVPKPTDPKPYPPAPEGNDVVKEPTVTPRTRRIVHLTTHTTHPIHSEEDIDLYLQRLKEQLMKYIGGNNDIIVS